MTDKTKNLSDTDEEDVVEDSFQFNISNNDTTDETKDNNVIDDSFSEESPLPTPSVKRALNRSTATPRIIKQVKESMTPLPSMDMFSPRFQSTIIASLSDESSNSDIIDNSSEDEIITPRKAGPSKFKLDSAENSPATKTVTPSRTDSVPSTPEVKVEDCTIEQRPIDTVSSKFQSTIVLSSTDESSNDGDDSKEDDSDDSEEDDSVVSKEDDSDNNTVEVNSNSTDDEITTPRKVGRSKFRLGSAEKSQPAKSPAPIRVISEAAATSKAETVSSPLTVVSKQMYEIQQMKIRQIQSDIQKAANVLRTINLNLLPDQGVSLRHRHKTLEQLLMTEVKKLSKMEVSKGDLMQKNIQSWAEIKTKAEAVQPKTFGARAMATYNAQKAVTMDRLQQLHGSLKTCPKETDLADDPKGLKVELMPHQKAALSWLMFREKQKPSGGILADDMGLGKTLTMISLMLKSKEIEDDSDGSDDSDAENKLRPTKVKGGTLVVCPASLINQWSSELERRTKRGLASWEMFHGPKRETKPKTLAKYDMVITTYAIVGKECEKGGAIFKVKWRRIILDEAHQIRNHKSQASNAVCKLSAISRWALTGTPVHNKELDMYALLKYLRCTPFDDLQVWRRWVGDKSSGGQERLHTVISSLMMRRTKVELIEKGSSLVLPERKWELVSVQLTKSELDVYNRILIFSRTLFAQFLHQRSEKRQDAMDARYESTDDQNFAPNQEYFAMRQKLLRLNKVKDIKQHEILVLLLRLRQICCHPSLITGMLHEDMETLGDDVEIGGREELDLLEQLNKMALNDADDVPEAHEDTATSSEGTGLKEAAKGLLNPNNPVFSKNQISSKIKVMLNVLKENVLGTDDKAIIVSQWPSFLRLIGSQLKINHVRYDQLDGQVPVSKRMEMVDSFNDPNGKLKVLLLSLTAGGVGLNLIGANHLFLLDLHWNPQLENQAQDRIYRVGQTKPVYVYKFIAMDTIEKKILDLQEKKLNIANSMLTGSKQAIVSKLTLDDLKMLFQM